MMGEGAAGDAWSLMLGTVGAVLQAAAPCLFATVRVVNDMVEP